MKNIVMDGHAHACGEYLTAEKIEQKLDKAGVDMVLLTPGQWKSKTTYGLKNLAMKNPYGDAVSKNNKTTSIMIKLIRAIKQIPKGNEYVYQLKCSLPQRIKQCYWVTRENWKNVQQDYQRMQFDSLKFHQCWEKFELEEEFFVKTVEWATENRLPIFIHIRDLNQMEKLIGFIKQHPDAIIVVGHLYGVELFMKERKEYFKNTYFDLSNYYFVSKERIMLAYQHFGADHLIFGSDTPYGKQSLENTLKQISELDISRSEIELILGENLMKLLN